MSKSDEKLAEAHISVGCVKAVYEWDWKEAEKKFQRGIELKSEYAIGHQWYAINYLTPLERFEEAQNSIQKALELEPSSLVINSTQGLIHYFSRDYQKAIESFEQTLQMNKDYPVTHFFQPPCFGFDFLCLSRIVLNVIYNDGVAGKNVEI